MTSSITSGHQREQQLIKHQSHPLTLLQDTLDPPSGVFKLFPCVVSVPLLFLFFSSSPSPSPSLPPPMTQVLLKGQTLDYQQQRIPDVKQCEPSQTATMTNFIPVWCLRTNVWLVRNPEVGGVNTESAERCSRGGVKRAWNSPYWWNQAAFIVHCILKWLKVFINNNSLF